MKTNQLSIGLLLLTCCFVMACSKSADSPKPPPPPPPDTTTKATVPAAPAGVTLTQVGDKFIQARISASSSDGGKPITGYTLVSDPVGAVDNNAGDTALVHKITSKNGIEYTFKAFATNAKGNSELSAASSALTSMDDTTRLLTGSRIGTDTIGWYLAKFYFYNKTTLTYEPTSIAVNDSLSTLIFFANGKFWRKNEPTNPNPQNPYNVRANWAWLDDKKTRVQLSLDSGDIVLSPTQFEFSFDSKNPYTGEIVRFKALYKKRP